MELTKEVLNELRENVYMQNTEYIPPRAKAILEDFALKVGGFKDRERAMLPKIINALMNPIDGNEYYALAMIPVPNDERDLHAWFSQDVRNMQHLTKCVGTGSARFGDAASTLRWCMSHAYSLMGTQLIRAIEEYNDEAV